MTVLQAHRALSDLVGDSIDITNIATNGMPDGARFTREIRDVCLTRAMYDVIRQLLNAVAPAPRSQGSKLLQSLSPQTTVRVTWVVPAAPTTVYAVGGEYLYTFNTVATGGTGGTAWRPLYIYGLRARRGGVHLPIAIKSSIEANGLLNSRNIQRPDTFAVYQANGVTAFLVDPVYGSPAGQLTIYDRQGELQPGDIIEIEYLPIPPPIDSSTAAGYNRVIELDAIREPQMMALAQMYMHISGQDIESIERYLPGMLDINKG